MQLSKYYISRWFILCKTTKEDISQQIPSFAGGRCHCSVSQNIPQQHQEYHDNDYTRTITTTSSNTNNICQNTVDLLESCISTILSVKPLLLAAKPVTSFTEEVNPRLGKNPLKPNGRLADLELTSLVKEATVFRLSQCIKHSCRSIAFEMWLFIPYRTQITQLSRPILTDQFLNIYPYATCAPHI